MSGLDIIGLALQYWWVAVWAAAIIAAYIWGGWRVALGVATLGAATAIYSKGRKDERTASESRQQAKERQDVQTVQKHRTEAQVLPDDELDKGVDKWTRSSSSWRSPH